MLRLVGLVAALAGVAAAAPAPATLDVDLGDAARRIYHVRLTLPVEPGPLALRYPRWIPGEHAPSGPVDDVVDLALAADGKPLAWRRDRRDLYRITCDVPPGAHALVVAFDFIPASTTAGLTDGSSLSHALAVVNWNQLLFYVDAPRPLERRYAATLRLPPGWSPASALPVRDRAGATTRFAPVTLATLVDSPVLAGAHLRTFPLAPDHELDVAGDDPALLAPPPATLAGIQRLVDEAHALFGGAHHRSYRFLVALSDAVAHFGLEHHESSDDRLPERAFADDETRLFWVRMLAHELVHSWNGKYRQPAAMATGDFHTTPATDLLWVYEGLTAYLGDVLTVRAGLWEPALLRGRLAQFADEMARRPGRAWRSLAGTAASEQLLDRAPTEGESLRRRRDVYSEGELLWLEVDATLRARSGGRRSLDDFCRRFFGGDGAPTVAPYTLDDLVAALDAVEPYDWRRFFAERVDGPGAPAPTGGLALAGWRLASGDEPNAWGALAGDVIDREDLAASIGLVLDDDGELVDVVAGSAAARAGAVAGAKLVAVNRREWSVDRLRDALRAGGTVDLLVEHQGWYDELHVDAGAGLRYPRLARDASRPDLLAAILRPRAEAAEPRRVSSARPPRVPQ